MQLHNNYTIYVICKYIVIYKLVGFIVAPKDCNDWLYKLWLMGHILPWEIYRLTDAEENTQVHCMCNNFGKCMYFNQVNNDSRQTLQK